MSLLGNVEEGVFQQLDETSFIAAVPMVLSCPRKHSQQSNDASLRWVGSGLLFMKMDYGVT